MDASTRPAFRPVLAWVSVTCAFLALDAAWLTISAPRLYAPALGHLMRSGFEPLAAALFYLLYTVGLVALVVRHAPGPRAAAGRGALFGVVAYGTYDLTNQATLVGWPWHITLIDLCWGGFATAVACALASRVATPRATG